MGNCCSDLTPQEELSRQLAKELRREEIKDSRILKILLLGTGESGKSTIFKQARSLFGQNYSDTELGFFREKVYFNIVGQMKSVIRFRRHKNISLHNRDLAQYEETIINVEKPSRLRELPPEVVEAIKMLWTDGGIQEVWSRRGEFQVFDCLEYFLSPDNFKRIVEGGNEYLPTFLDALQCRDKTAGIITEKLRINETEFNLFDVGGQRPERKKWLNCFDNVTTIIFVAAINEYDQNLYEADDVNRIQEALDVWEDIVNRDGFRDIGFVMFLNKWDIFREKVCRIPLKVEGQRNEDYSGPDPMTFEDGSPEQVEAIDSCFRYMEQKFISKVNTARNGVVESYQTIATDNTIMDKVFANCQHQLLHSALNSGGFHAMGA